MRNAHIPTAGKDPEIICSSSEYKELKWIAGEFYWMESVQPYDEGGWNYLAELKKFVAGGMTDTGFINAVSGIVNRGCHNPVSDESSPDHATSYPAFDLLSHCATPPFSAMRYWCTGRWLRARWELQKGRQSVIEV